jgi:ACR3 family arsenite efflux pump ArsB
VVKAASTDNMTKAKAPAMGTFERYLTLWVALCIVAGVALGQMLPGLFRALGAATVAEVNLPVAVLAWLMIVPMLLKIDLAALGQVRSHWRGIAVTVGVNWLIKPFSMALLGWLFVGYLFRPLLPAGQIDAYVAGLILLAAAPCTAMVLCGRILWMANRISRCRKSRSTTRLWWWPSRRLSRCFSACPQSPCRGIRCCFRSSFISSCR